MSTEHEVRVVILGPIIKHPDADTLGITEVDGRPVIVRLGEYNEGDLAIYVPVDSLCPIADERFAFLAQRSTPKEGRCRLRAARLRGIFSMGLLVRPDLDMAPGEEVRERLDITVYEPPEIIFRQGGSYDGGQQERDPGVLPVYDVESARKWWMVLEEDEEIVLTEKIHGANARYVFHDGRLWCGSRTTFKRLDGGGMWVQIAEKLGLAERLSAVPGIAIYGEAFGQVQDLKYGQTGHDLVLFDALDTRTRRYLDYDDFLSLARDLGLPVVPELYRGPWSVERKAELFALAEGSTVLGNGAHVREGWVLRTTKERADLRLGRVQMKLPGEGYLTRKGG